MCLKLLDTGIMGKFYMYSKLMLSNEDYLLGGCVTDVIKCEINIIL
jgi:hypothetical protein